MQRPFFLEDPSNAVLRGNLNVRHSIIEEEDVKPEMMSKKKWLFRVLAHDLKPEETVCVIGNVPELGEWVPENCVPLIRENEDDDVWANVISIPDVYVEYRYCICVLIEPHLHVVVCNWETFIEPRHVNRHTSSPTSKDDPELYGDYNTDLRSDRGWITKETVVQIKLLEDAVTLWRPRYQNRKVLLKMTPINLAKHCTNIPKSMAEALDESLSTDTQDNFELSKHAFTEVAVLNSEESSFQVQPQFGMEVGSQMIIIQSTILHPQNTAFLIDLYVYSSRCMDDQPPYHAGFTYLLPGAFQSSEGKCILALTSTKHRPLGELKLSYLVVKSIANLTCDMKTSYAKHWKKTRSGLEVGHRGSGSSFKIDVKNCAEVRENTLASFKTAINHGADYVEFDVQLTKDFVPVIYHDFHVYVAMRKKKELDDYDLLECPLKDLTLHQLKLLKVYHLSEGKSKKERFFDEGLEEHQPFPTLQQAFEALNPHVGFNIEIKSSMQQKDGTYESEVGNSLDINSYIDIILKCVLQHAGNRRIIFSCFNPDICSMIRYKQNKYPVMFLTQGESSKYSPYIDPRCWNVKAAVSFAQMLDILGVNVHSEDILRDPKLVQLAKQAGLIVFCWGDENADSAVINHLKELGLHGIIYDKVDHYSTKEVKESIFLVEARESQKDLLRLVAENAHQNVQPIASPSAQFVHIEKLVDDVNRAREDLDRLSTCTTLDSLESMANITK